MSPASTTTYFYRDMPALRMPVAQALQDRYFRTVPPDWSIVLSDIQGSTGAIAAGRHNDVNLIAGGSLIAGLNVARAHGVEIPFFFGGDGCTFLVPPSLLGPVLGALALHHENTVRNFGLHLHTGAVAVGNLPVTGCPLRLARLEIDQTYARPILTGDGLQHAERIIKSGSHHQPSGDDLLNLEGLQCRWDRIKPPLDQQEVVCYLIEATTPATQLSVFRAALEKIDAIYGRQEERHPLSARRLKLLFSFSKIRKETLAKWGSMRPGYALKTFVHGIIGALFFRWNLRLKKVRGQEYLAQLIAHSDTLTIDGRICTILSGTVAQRERLVAWLRTEEAQGRLHYGHHVTGESVMTCYVEDLNDRHLHFVDGADGGYTAASVELKAKLALLKN